jgi:hypothetical protein
MPAVCALELQTSASVRTYRPVALDAPATPTQRGCSVPHMDSRLLSPQCAFRNVLSRYLGYVFGPLIVWLLKRGDSPEIDEHGKESLNFSDIDVNLQRDRWCPLSRPNRLYHSANPAHFESGAGDRRVDPGASEGKFYRYPLTIRLY